MIDTQNIPETISLEGAVNTETGQVRVQLLIDGEVVKTAYFDDKDTAERFMVAFSADLERILGAAGISATRTVERFAPGFLN